MSKDQASERHGPLRSFGRRRSRRLTPRQTRLLEDGSGRHGLDLSAPLPNDIATLFQTAIDEVWLEIGFGGGEHLLWQATHHPRIGFLAAEPFIDGVVKVADGIERLGIGNVRLYPDDARILLSHLPDASIARAFILFPDPWPKKRHVKRRLVQPALVAELARIMRPGSELRLATDIAGYVRQMLTILRHDDRFRWLARSTSNWRVRPHDWPPTRYEQKARREGRHCCFLRYERAPIGDTDLHR